MFGLTPSRGHRSQQGNLTPWGGPRHQLRDAFDALFDNFMNQWMTPLSGEGQSMRFWDFDVQEGDKEILVRAEMPGFEPNDVNVQLTDNVLTIQAEKRQEGQGREEFNSYARTLTLPAGIDADKAQASYRNGVLELHIPRTAQAQGKRITVQGQSASEAQAVGMSKQPQGNGGEKPATTGRGKK